MPREYYFTNTSVQIHVKNERQTTDDLTCYLCYCFRQQQIQPTDRNDLRVWLRQRSDNKHDGRLRGALRPAHDVDRPRRSALALWISVESEYGDVTVAIGHFLV